MDLNKYLKVTTNHEILCMKGSNINLEVFVNTNLMVDAKYRWCTSGYTQ
jgi:hypothetical protein